MTVVSGTVKTKLGQFYVGDPCYVLSEYNYDEVFGGNDYQDGKYTGKTVDGKEFDFILAGTKYGDGEYQDQHGYSYGVDAGILGVVPVELCEKDGKKMSIDELNRLGHVFYGYSADFSADDGEFYIILDEAEPWETMMSADINDRMKVIQINTGDEEDDEYDDDYYDEDED